MKSLPRKAFCILLTLMLLISATGCGNTNESTTPSGNEAQSEKSGKQSSGEKYMLGLSTATAGGTYYQVGGALAQMWTRALKGENISVSAQASNGSVDNVNRMKQGATELALCHNKVAMWAQNGDMMFDGQSYDDFSAISAMWPNIVEIVVDKNINDIEELKGKRVVVGAINSGNETDARLVFETLGLEYTDKKVITPEYVGYNEAADALKNKKVQGAMYTGGLPTAAVMDVLASTDCKILSLDDETIEFLIEEYPFYEEFVIPKGTYPNQDEDVKTVCYANLVVANNDVPDDVVYKLISSFYDNLPDMQESFQSLKTVSLERAATGVPIPFHPGAEKFLKEKGIIK